MDKLSCMKTFCQVVKSGNFSLAAKKLNVSKVMVSRSVGYLEAELGIRLFQRTTRKMSLTDDGNAYYQRCQSLIDEFNELDILMKDNAQTVKGTLRIAVPSEAFTSLHLLPFFRQLLIDFPELSLDINMSDRLVDIVEEGFDAAIRIGELSDSSLIAKKIASVELVLCASQQYLAQLTTQNISITHPHDVIAHPFILDSNYRHGKQLNFTHQSDSLTVTVNSTICVNSAVATCDFINNGMGIGITPDFMIKDNPNIVKLLPNWKISQGGIYVVYSSRKHLSAKVKCLVSEVSQYFANNFH